MTKVAVKDYFLSDVATHKLEIIRDDGVDRHIRFSRPGTIDCRFDLITWPGHLCVTGDCGTYVFQRLHDMFKFFRMDWHTDDLSRNINTGYWAEKCIARDRDGITEFCEESFTRVVLGDLVSWIKENREDTTKEQRRELWEAVVDEVIRADSDGGGHRQQIAAYDFRHEVSETVGDFCFQDLWERNFTKYTHRYLWNCFAIAWGIHQYDLHKEAQAQQEGRPCYSEDGETFRDGDLVEALRNSDAAVPGRTIYLGKSAKLKVARLFSIESIIERMSEMACDEVGDTALGDWPEPVSLEAQQELESALVKWAENHCMADAPYRVVDVVEHVVTEDDLKLAGVELP